MNLNTSISVSQLLGVWGTPRDPYWCIKPIWFKINDINPERRFVNLFGEFSPLWGSGTGGQKCSLCHIRVSFTVQARSRYKLSENKFYFALFFTFSDRLVGSKPSHLWIPQEISAISARRTGNSNLELWNYNRQRNNTSGPNKHENHVQHPGQTNWDLGQISCNNMSSSMLIKGQLISEWLLDVFILTEKQTKIFLCFCPTSLK